MPLLGEVLHTITQICLSLTPVKLITGAGEGKYRLFKFSPPSSRGCPKTKPQNPQQIYNIHTHRSSLSLRHPFASWPAHLTLFPAPPPLFDVCCLRIRPIHLGLSGTQFVSVLYMVET
jgi:hypothetical protein